MKHFFAGILTFACLMGNTGLAAERTKASKAEQTVFDYFGDRKPILLRLWPESSARNKSRNGKSEEAKLTNNLRYTNTESPSLLVYPPPADAPNTGVAMIFCPGGAYNILAMSNPKEFTAWMNHLGVTVATLKYHVPRDRKTDPDHQWPLADAQRAMRVLRSEAKALKLNPEMIGIVGSSAGGHLAMNLCVNHAHPAYERVDALDDLSSRPAFGYLFYPAYLTKNKNSMDVSPSWHADRIDRQQTPPIFVTINGDDGFVAGSLRAMVELKKAKVPGELHVWTKGGHGGVFAKYPLAEHARPGFQFLVRRGVLPESLQSRSDAWLDSTVEALNKDKPNVRRELPAEAKPPRDETQLSPIDADVRKRYGQAREVYRLWPGDGTREDDPLKNVDETSTQRKVVVGSKVTAPTMTFFPAKNPDGRAVLVFPGGGYGVLAYKHEGLDVCKWLNEQGIHSFLVKYRTPRRQGLEKHEVALQDAHRAIRLVRSQTVQFGVHPDSIGVLGFSAGGHLWSLASSPLDSPSYQPIDDHDEASPVADFGILIYPAYTTTQGETVDPMLLPKRKPTVPLFVATALDDKWTEGQFYFLYERLKKKQPIEYHIYENGGHGKGMHNGAAFAFGQWPRECSRWLRDLNKAAQ